jgi:hypothetical protein
MLWVLLVIETPARQPVLRDPKWIGFWFCFSVQLWENWSQQFRISGNTLDNIESDQYLLDIL